MGSCIHIDREACLDASCLAKTGNASGKTLFLPLVVLYEDALILANTFPGEIGDGYGGHEDGSSVQPAQ